MDRLQIQMRVGEDHTGRANNIQAGTAFKIPEGILMNKSVLVYYQG